MPEQLNPNSLAITTDFNGGKNNPVEPITQAAEAGFDAVMWCHEWNSDRLYTPDEMKGFKKTLRSRGISLLDIHASEGADKFWLSSDSETHQKGIELVENRIKMASQLGADTIVLHVPSERDARFSWGQFRSAMDRLLPTLEEEGVRLAFENLYQETVKGEYHPENTDALKKIMVMYDSPHVGICLDSGHANISGLEGETLAQFRDRIQAVHLHDNNGEVDEHRIPLTGTVDWHSVMDFLAHSSYRSRPLNFESSLKTHADQGMTVNGFLDLMKLTGVHLAGIRNEFVERDARHIATPQATI